MQGDEVRLRVFEVLYATAPDEVYGLELMDLAEIPSGSLYPILARFRTLSVDNGVAATHTPGT